MPVQLPDMPVTTELVTQGRKMTEKWINWNVFLLGLFQKSVRQVGTAREVDQEASIGLTPISVGGLVKAGRYRITVSARVTRVATTSSELQVHAHANDGVAYQFDSPNATGNATSTVVTVTAVVDVAANTSLAYSVTYLSAGATAMQFKVWATVEALPL